jgi:hypothetical protein
MCSHTDDDPGPPLKAMRSGRFDRSATPSRVYATKNIPPSMTPVVSLRTGSIPTVAV